MCPEHEQLHAYFDGELAPGEQMHVKQHLAACATCRAELATLQAGRSALRAQFREMQAPQPLRASILRALDAEEQQVRPARRAAGWRRPFWLGMLGGVGGLAVTAALAFFLLFAPQMNLPEQLVAAHVQALRSGHMIAVVSTDRHTVKPWFAGRADVSPVVVDFADQGYRLLGGRTDAIDRQHAAVVVYEHGAHFINVFSWHAGTAEPPPDTTLRGYHLAFWKTQDLMYCAVSDTGWSELKGLEQLLSFAGERELRP
ncbi:MAG TPA: zf-HC2 domain-containing protein [Steroidobacteraceae bacterium]|jgi:anti-sigma factor RsiW